MWTLRAPSFTMQPCVSKSLRKFYYLIPYILAGLLIISCCLGKMWIYWGKSSWCFIGWCMPSECKSTRSVSNYMFIFFYQFWCLESKHVLLPHISLSFPLFAFKPKLLIQTRMKLYLTIGLCQNSKFSVKPSKSIKVEAFPLT